MSDINTESKPLIRVLGAGVIGCTSALKLAESGKYTVEVIAKDLPTDVESQGFASPWAGAHWRSTAPSTDERWIRWDTTSYKVFVELAKTEPTLIRELGAVQYFKEPFEDPWYSTVLPNFRRLSESELPETYTGGFSYESVSIQTHLYLAWLQSRLESLGVKILRKQVDSIYGLFNPTEGEQDGASVVVNCTGLGAKSLIGVADPEVEPVKGQTVLVQGPEGLNKTVTAGDTYIIPRPDGTVILGGCRLTGDYSLTPSPALSKHIISSCYALEPSLSIDGNGVEGVRVSKVNVGLRPSRRGGPRLRSEKVVLKEGREVVVVHAYGIGGAGYQSSWGMAEDVLQLVDAEMQ